MFRPALIKIIAELGTADAIGSLKQLMEELSGFQDLVAFMSSKCIELEILEPLRAKYTRRRTDD
jgi:hypothetical protein